MTTTPALPVVAASIPSSDKALMILSHLSALLGVGFVLPFIVWLVKRRDFDGVSAHAAEALNFHLSFLLYTLCSIPLILVFGLGIVLVVTMALASIVLAIIAAVRASNGELYHYPLTIRLVK